MPPEVAPDPAIAAACHNAASLLCGLLWFVLIGFRISAWNYVKRGCCVQTRHHRAGR